MKTIKFNYKKKYGSETEREIFGAKIVKELKNELEILEDESAKYIVGWELNEEGLTDNEKQVYKDTIKDYFYEIAKLENYLRENNLDAKRIQYKTFLKEGVNNVIIK